MASSYPLMGRSNMSTYPPGREERSQRRQRRVATAARASTTAAPPVKQCQTNLDRPQPRPQSRCSRWTFHLSVLLSHTACPPRASRPSPPHQEGHHPPATRLEDMRSPCLGERHHSATILGEWHHPVHQHHPGAAWHPPATAGMKKGKTRGKHRPGNQRHRNKERER